MLGPAVHILDMMGAKDDVAIFSRGEWWRLLSCGWLHSGIFHLVLNMVGTVSLGVPLERVFGFWRTALLYTVSYLTLPYTLHLTLPYGSTIHGIADHHL